MIELVGAVCFIAGWFAYPMFHVEPDAFQPALEQLKEAAAPETKPEVKQIKSKQEVKPKYRTWSQIRIAAEAKSELEAEAK